MGHYQWKLLERINVPSLIMGFFPPFNSTWSDLIFPCAEYLFTILEVDIWIYMKKNPFFRELNTIIDQVRSYPNVGNKRSTNLPLSDSLCTYIHTSHKKNRQTTAWIYHDGAVACTKSFLCPQSQKCMETAGRQSLSLKITV